MGLASTAQNEAEMGLAVWRSDGQSRWGKAGSTVLIKSTGPGFRASGSSCPVGKSLSLPGPQFPIYRTMIHILPFSQGWCGDQGRQWLEECHINCKCGSGSPWLTSNVSSDS